jgi:hypothetical protein
MGEVAERKDDVVAAFLEAQRQRHDRPDVPIPRP